MRSFMIVVGLAAVAGCGGISKEQYGQKEAEAEKYKQALQDETTKAKSLEQQNAALQTQAGEAEKKLADTSAESAKLQQQGGECVRRNEELQGQQMMKLSEQLLFAQNSSKLSPEARKSLDSVAEAVAPVKDKFVIVGGYTDDTEGGGKSASSKRWQLSTNRALAVANYLAGRGIDPKNISVAGFGQSRPAAPNDSMANRALNRRAEIALAPKELTLGTIDVKPAELQTK